MFTDLSNAEGEGWGPVRAPYPKFTVNKLKKLKFDSGLSDSMFLPLFHPVSTVSISVIVNESAF